jgi:hypothetical protein
MEIDMKNLDRPARTVSDVNNIFIKIGLPGRLVKGKGYVYWTGGDSDLWIDGSMICVYRLTDLTIREYIQDYAHRLQKHMRIGEHPLGSDKWAD